MNEYAKFIIVYLALEYRIINSVLFRFCYQLFLVCHNRNYNPVERRCKGGKGGATMKGCQKAAKSLQTHNMHSHGSGDSVEPSKASTHLVELICFR